MSGPQSGWNGNRHTPAPPPRTSVPISKSGKSTDAPERRPLSPRRQSPAGGAAISSIQEIVSRMLLLAIAVLPSITALLRPSFGKIAALYHRRRHLATLPIAQPEPPCPAFLTPQPSPPTVNPPPSKPSFRRKPESGPVICHYDNGYSNHRFQRPQPSFRPLPTVIPACAGIYGYRLYYRIWGLRRWIPAFAGMTVWGPGMTVVEAPEWRLGPGMTVVEAPEWRLGPRMTVVEAPEWRLYT